MMKIRMLNLFVIALLVVAFLPARQVVLADTPPGDQLPPDAQFVPGELVVSFANGSSPAVYSQRANAMAQSLGGQVARQSQNTALLSFTPNASVTALLKRIYSFFPDVSVQPNYVYRLPEQGSQLKGSLYHTSGLLVKSSGAPVKLSTAELLSLRTGSKIAGSPAFPNEIDTAWGWQQVGGAIIWSQALSTANVCLIDTGVDTAHPEFAGLTLAGYDYVNGDTIPNDDNGHGTHLAGIIMAKANNGAGTAIGIASTKLVPVKAANAQGWGTSYNVAAALTFCAGQSTVKVINLSLVSSNPDPLVYGVLYTAIVTKGKLVVVAAGNDSKSYVTPDSGTTWMPASFPGGWAIVNVDKNGTYHDTLGSIPSSIANKIYSGLISVAAGRDPSLQTWVDTELDPDPEINSYRTIQSPEELHANCATEFTNYGNWVSIVAPGGNIYSTTPKSYPFYMNYQFGVPAGYGVMSGTSQAAAFVSGAASRVWGVYPTMTVVQMKTRLINSGTSLEAVDTLNGNGLVTDLGNSLLGSFDPNQGFNNPSDYTVPYGTPFNPVDDSQSPTTVLAPFCWPTTTSGPPVFTAMQDMSGASYLNVASAMNRVAFWVTALDGSSGIPLAGAVVTAKVGTAVKATATVPAGLTRDQPDVALINVPLNSDALFTPQNATFTLQISKTGYTNSAQTFDTVSVVASSQDGAFITDPYSRVSLLPSTLIQAVVDWNPPAGFDYTDTITKPLPLFPDLDAVLFLPSNVGPTSSGAVVGPPDRPADIANTNGKYLGAGTLLDAIKICGTTTCTFSPYALYQHDGGLDQGLDANGNRLFSATVEGISIASSGTASAPTYLKPKYTSGAYTFFVTANDPSFLNSDAMIYPVVRLWSKGNLIGTYKLENATGCDTDNSWWRVVTLNNTTLISNTNINTCGPAATLFPYTP